VPGSSLIAPEQALELVLARVRPLESQAVALADALGRVLAEPVSSADDVPPFDSSAMDGFAVRAEDTAGAGADTPVELDLAGESRAGAPAARGPEPGEAVRISTGAMLPPGADSVVRVEDTAEHDDVVEVHAEVAPGREVRRAGEDIRAGELVLAAGRRIGPAELGVAASIGAAELRCRRLPTVSILVTGDELVPPGVPLEAGQIRNSNGVALASLASEAGAQVTSLATVGDDYRATVDALGSALAADVAVTTGGVSVGPHDHVKPALAELGVEEVFWGVALRPGKPTWFGVRDRTLVFGLPGNPVSAMVTFHLFVRPALRALQGADPRGRRAEAVIEVDYPKRPGRAHYLRCRLDAREDGWHVRPTKDQGSHVLTSMLDAEALAYVEVDRGDVKAGERVEIEIL
jgi:molybdopterin molybdotransferase